MSQKNMGRLAQDMKRELIAIIGRLKDPRLEGGDVERALSLNSLIPASPFT